MRRVTAMAAFAGLCCQITLAQTGAAPTFDAASIKQSAPDAETFLKAHPGGRLELSRQTLQALIALAWRLQEFQVSGGPAWVRSERLNVNTEAAGDPSEDQLLLMLQTLLKERFSLKVHLETAARPVYILLPAKIGKTPPPGLQVTTPGSCVKPDPAASPDPNACGSIGLGTNHLEAHEVSLSRLAEVLGRVVDRRVIDQTSRPEKFNITLRWHSDDADTPSIFTALREQLGLRLEAGKAPVELLVIDHAEKPDQN